MYWIGLISGTSADGVDAALVEFAEGRANLVDVIIHPWPGDLQAKLIELGQGGSLSSLDEYGTFDVRCAEVFAQAVDALLAKTNVRREDVIAIGSHGQTVRHRPAGADYDGLYPFTLQIGDPHVLAERTGITVVADFRRRDVAAGGQGAPLVPAFHADLLYSSDESRAVLNLGGIANFTLLPAAGAVRGFDTGPANALMDAWCQYQTGRSFDCDGEYAASGVVDDALLARLLDEEWFLLPPPKSTGREQFHLDWVKSKLSGTEKPEDVQATLLALTVRTVVNALHANQPDTSRMLVCGGGVHNSTLLRALQDALPNVAVASTADVGLDPDAVEAMAFAWLAMRTMNNLPGNIAAVTGAQGPRVLGSVFPAA